MTQMMQEMYDILSNLISHLLFCYMYILSSSKFKLVDT